MVPIADASAAHLLPALAQVVEPGTIAQADSWKAYSGLNKLGYNREVIRQSVEISENLILPPRYSNDGCWALIKGPFVPLI